MSELVARTVGGVVVHATLQVGINSENLATWVNVDGDLRDDRGARIPFGNLLKESVLVIVTPVTIGKCHQTQQVCMSSSLRGSGTCVRVRYGDILTKLIIITIL